MSRTKIAYLLHRFPATTDTFIKREIRSLQKAGTDVQVISVWKPLPDETTPDILAEWNEDTHFILPRSPLSVARISLALILRSPRQFFNAGRLALKTARPGFVGFAYQLFYFLEAVLVADLLRRNTVNHLHNHIGDQSGTVTMLAASMAGIDYSITFHGWPVFFDAKYSRIKEKVLGARFTRSISYFCRSQLMMFSDCDNPSAFKVVHCGLSIAKYPFRPPRAQIERLFCAARLSPEKGLMFLIHALAILRDRGHDLELRLAGDGPSRKALSDLAEELDVSDRVSFLGYLSEEKIIDELQAADLFVLPSFVEGIPVSAMEAMAVGVPVIATNIAGTSELIDDGRTGILVRPSDAQSLADAVVRMKEDHCFRLSASYKAREKVATEFEVDQETAKLNSYLLESCR